MRASRLIGSPVRPGTIVLFSFRLNDSYLGVEGDFLSLQRRVIDTNVHARNFNGPSFSYPGS
jgi:hypothetical protein